MGLPMDIAIIGMACRLPGDATSPENLWKMLMEKASAMSETPPDRFNIDAFHHPHGDKNGTINQRGGHFLKEDIAAFDAPFFSISPLEANAMDPMQRILLEVVYEAIENSGIPLSKLAGSNTGCYVGCFTSDYDELTKRDTETMPKYQAVGGSNSLLSNRVSFSFDLRGPSMTLDTACSSGLVAIHLACQSLRMGESTTAVVGATNAILSPDRQISMTNLHFLSEDSKCQMFDDKANGYARGEGMAAMILKPVEHAIRDGNTIRAVIRGTAVNSNGKTTPGLTMPSKIAQMSLIRSAYSESGCDPASTAYVEAHGTGTPAGDPVEAEAITNAMRTGRGGGANAKLYVGSVKTNIGHLEGASGLAGLLKAVLSVEKGIIAPNLWFENGNPAIDFDGWGIRVPTEPMNWQMSGVRQVGINNFGFGGTNCHVIIQDALHYLQQRGLKGNHRTCTLPGCDSPVTIEKSDKKRSRVFILSAETEKSVLDAAKASAKYVFTKTNDNDDDDDDQFLRSMAFTLGERRSKFSHVGFVVAATKQELVKELEGLSHTYRPTTTEPSVAFVFTGQGAQWWAMARELIDYPVFRATINACDRAIQSLGSSWSILDELLRSEKDSRINQTEISQTVCTALQIGLVDLYMSWKIHPTSVVGHSSGEIAAAYTIGALTLESAIRIAYFRGILSSQVKIMGYKGGMLAAGLSEEEASSEIEAIGHDFGKAVIACINGPRSVTISGDMDALMELKKRLTARGLFARKLQVDTAYHSHHMLAISEAYRERLRNLQTNARSEREITMYSSLTGRPVLKENLGPAYWVENLVSCVRFSDALGNLCKGEAAGVLIELGPHSALSGPVKQVVAANRDSSSPIEYLSALTRGRAADVTALEVAGTLIAQGYPADIRAIQQSSYRAASSETPSMLTDLPSYSWNHARKYWSESRLSLDYRFRQFPRTDILGAPFHDWNPIEPRWRNFIRLSEQPWIRSHVIQGAIVYPAAGYCCMALEAARQLHSLAKGVKGPLEGFKIRELSMSRALIVPQTEEGIEVVFSMRPYPNNSVNSSETCNEFRVFSCSTSREWAEHCRGLLSVVHTSFDVGYQCRIMQETYKDYSGTSLQPKDVYASFDAVGLSWGPEFQGIVQLQAGEGQAQGIVQVTDTKSGMPKEFEFDQLIHPVTLDSLLHTAITALCHGDLKNVKETFMPTFMEHIYVSASMSTVVNDKLWVAAESQLHGFRHARSKIVATQNGCPVIWIDGLKFRAMSTVETGAESFEVPRHSCSVSWEPDVDLLDVRECNHLLRQGEQDSPRRLADLELLARYFTHQALNEVSEKETQNMLPHYRRFFLYMQHQYERQRKEFEALASPPVAAKIQRLIGETSDTGDYEGRMTVRMGRALISVLRGEVDPLDLMMKDNLLHDYYSVSLGVTSTYAQLSKYLAILSHKYPDFDYLEIGAGTGGATKPALESLGGPKHPRLKSYTYTDTSTGFIKQATANFGGWGNLIQFKKLDIEHDPCQQGFEGKQFDVILAANVLHATSDIHRTILHVRQLLKPGGKLILLEMTQSLLSVSLIFGTLPGWWSCSESWRQLGPLLTESRWQDILHHHGFTEFQVNSPDTVDSSMEVTRVMVASVGRDSDTKHDNNSSGVNSLSGISNINCRNGINTHDANTNTIIVRPNNQAADARDLVTSLSHALARTGVSTNIYTLAELKNLDISDTTVISLVELDDALLVEISPDDFHTTQRLTQESAGIVWVTRGGITKGSGRPELALFHGFARSLRSEQAGFPCITMDLSAEPKLPADDAARLIMKVYEQTLGRGIPYVRAESEFMEQDGLLFIKRALEDANAIGMNKYIADQARPAGHVQTEMQELWQNPRHLKLTLESVGNIESFFFDDAEKISQPLAADEVEIDLRAVGLNFRDILIAMAEIEDNYLGNECSGVITKVGASVQNVRVGDRVAAWSLGSFSTRVRNPANRVYKIPDDVGFAAAAAVPVAHITAYYCLVHVARLRKGDRILIHTASGGVGQSAIQLAKWLQAEVFVTAGTEDKRKHLATLYDIPETNIFSSRDLSFVDGIQSVTGGRGVDVILNSLAGEFLEATWRCLAPFGRFVEIGKRDIDSNMRLEMAPFVNNVSFSSVSALILMQDKALAGEIFSAAMKMFVDGAIKEANPLHVLPFSQIEHAFRQMQGGKHVGKFVFELTPGDLVKVRSPPMKKLDFQSDASYLLSGGLGGLGRSISRWMVKRGARNFIFVSRGGASSPDAVNLINELSTSGVRCAVLKCDTSDEGKLATALATGLPSQMPPIRGVIQCSMVLNDGLISNMSVDSWTSTIRPKVQGSRALHNVTLGQPLDFFVLLSSISEFIGSSGQANYAAACAYQVALAAQRRNLGLPAVAVDIGKVSSVGYIAERTSGTAEKNLVRLGMIDIEEDELHAILELCILPEKHSAISGGHMVTGAHSDITRNKGELPFWARDPVFSHMQFVRPHLGSAWAEKTQANEQIPLSDLLAKAASMPEAIQHVLDGLIGKLARSLVVAVEDIKPSRSLPNYGIDSLMAVEIRNWIARTLQVDIPVFEILQATTLTSLAVKLTRLSPLCHDSLKSLNEE